MANLWHNLWLRFGRKDHQYFLKQQQYLDKVQEAILLQNLSDNKNTIYGKLHHFDKIKSKAEYSQKVPIVEDFGLLQEYIDLISKGRQKVLTQEPILAFESTSGSNGKAKLIPYTSSLKSAFQKSINIWMNELNLMRPNALSGKAYWSISPPLKEKYTTQSGIPVGMESDDEYFDPISKVIIRRIMAVNKNVLQSTDSHEFYLNSAAQLLSCTSLSFISIWNPNFIIKLDHFIHNNLDEILAQCIISKERKKELKQNGFHWHKHFTDLDTLSCWTDGQAKMWLPQIENMFNHINIQPKGLLSTEGVISIPTRQGNALAYTSHYYEFRDIRTGSIHDCTNLIVSEKYEVILTNGAGLYRYNTRDVVLVTSINPLPILQFVGRSGNVVDMVGEKVDALSVHVMIENLIKEFTDIESILLRPYQIGSKAGYELVVIVNKNLDTESLMHKAVLFLNENPYYKQAVDIKQLNPLSIRIIKPSELLEINEIYAQHFSIKDGDVKLPVLLPINFLRDKYNTNDSDYSL